MTKFVILVLSCHYLTLIWLNSNNFAWVWDELWPGTWPQVMDESHIIFKNWHGVELFAKVWRVWGIVQSSFFLLFECRFLICLAFTISRNFVCEKYTFSNLYMNPKFLFYLILIIWQQCVCTYSVLLMPHEIYHHCWGTS